MPIYLLYEIVNITESQPFFLSSVLKPSHDKTAVHIFGIRDTVKVTFCVYAAMPFPPKDLAGSKLPDPL
jgi:hypothetical protein